MSTLVVVRAWIFKRLRAKGCSSSPSPSSGVQILHVVLGPREYVVLEELPLGQRFIKLTQQELRCALGCASRACPVRAESLADTRPLGVAERVDKTQVGRHQRLKRAVSHHGLDGATPVTEALTGTGPWSGG